MDKENAQNVKKGEATEDDFPFNKAFEQEMNAKLSKEDRITLFSDETEFNKEVQLYVLNRMHKRMLTTNFVVGTLYKLAWSILHHDFIEQMKVMDKYKKGGR